LGSNTTRKGNSRGYCDCCNIHTYFFSAKKVQGVQRGSDCVIMKFSSSDSKRREAAEDNSGNHYETFDDATREINVRRET